MKHWVVRVIDQNGRELHRFDMAEGMQVPGFAVPAGTTGIRYTVDPPTEHEVAMDLEDPDYA